LAVVLVALGVTLCVYAAVATTTTISPSWSNNSHYFAGAIPADPKMKRKLEPTVVGELISETGFYQSIQVTQESPLYQKQSAFQMIEVRRSPYYGKVLVLDGVVQVTERDGSSYNEMLTHIPMFQNAAPSRILVIGGGDGYVVSEVLKHASVSHVDHVDLDEDVIAICKEHFEWSEAWEDPRVHLHIADGAKFVATAPDQSYDVIIQDSSDPWTWGEKGERVSLPSGVLYSSEHFANIHRILKPNGILNIQAESLQIPSDLDGIRDWRKLALVVGFESARYGSILTSSYPTGQIGFLLCEKNVAAAETPEGIERRFARIVDAQQSTIYYHPPLQTATFVLPLWAMKHIYDDEAIPFPTYSADEL
jgi:spermidine synthase